MFTSIRSVKSIFSEVLEIGIGKYNQKWIELTFAISLIILNSIIYVLKPVSDVVYLLSSVSILPIALFVILMSRWISPTIFFNNNLFRLWVVPIIISAIIMVLFDYWDAELVHVYRSLFTALSNRQNPYLEPVIYHRLVDESVVYSQFNYPPGEIPFYLLAYLLLRQWNYGIIISANLMINGFVALIFYYKIPNLNRRQKLPYVFLLLVTGLHNSVSTIFLSLMMAGTILLDGADNHTLTKRIGLILAISLGLLAKFFMIPFAAVYFWHRIVEKRQYSYFIDAAMILLIVSLVFLPFGWFNVVKSTIFFNMNLDVRAEVTTFSFNLLSFLCCFLNIRILYAPIAVILFFITIHITRHLSLLNRIVFVSTCCLLLFPTPENQFFGSIFGLLVLSKVSELRKSSLSKIYS